MIVTKANLELVEKSPLNLKSQFDSPHQIVQLKVHDSNDYLCVCVCVCVYEGIPSTEETMSTLLTAMQSGSQSKLGSLQYPECPVSEWSGNMNSITSSGSNNGQAGNVCVHSPSHTRLSSVLHLW